MGLGVGNDAIGVEVDRSRGGSVAVEVDGGSVEVGVGSIVGVAMMECWVAVAGGRRRSRLLDADFEMRAARQPYDQGNKQQPAHSLSSIATSLKTPHSPRSPGEL